MTLLDIGDLNDVLRIGQAVLECDSMTDLQENALRHGMHSLASTSGVYFNVCRHDDRFRFLPGTVKGMSEEIPARWLRGFQDLDPFAQRFLDTVGADAGKVVVSTGFVTRQAFGRSVFYNEFLKRIDVLHVLIIGLSSNGLPIGMFGFHRPPGATAFSEAEVSKARLLTPHLSAAVQKVRALDLLEERHFIMELLADDLTDDGFAIFDNHLQASFFHRKGGRAAAPFSCASDIPAAVITHCRAMRSALSFNQRLPPVEQFDMEAASQRWHFSIRLITDCKSGTRFVVRFRQLCGVEGRTASRLAEVGLTRREIEIAQLVATGMSNAKMADQLCISVRTVQNHLRAIYEKANIHNRASLVSCVYGNRPGC